METDRQGDWRRKSLWDRAVTGNPENYCADQLTPTVAADQLAEIHARMEEFRNALTQAASALRTFRIGDERLEPGECEIGMLIPRYAVDNRLIHFADELKELGFILNTFSEVATGQVDDLDIKTLSSSEFLVFLNAHSAQFAACLAVAIERTVALYKTLLEIRKLQVEIAKQGVPESKTKGIEEHANSVMTDGLAALSVTIVQELYKGTDKGRKNELTNAVQISLNNIANRIDRGYNVEVRCSPLPAPDDAADEVKKAITTVQQASANTQFLNLEGKSILSLPEKPEKSEKEKPERRKKEHPEEK